MASLRDAILGLGQRIDRHQAPPILIQGTTPRDSSTPPPSPPSGPTMQPDYTVPSPPPPPVQSALLSFACQTLRDTLGLDAPVFTCSCIVLLCAGIVHVSRRELEALRQRQDGIVTSFISRCREKITHIIDRSSECDQISMIMCSLQPCYARHLMGFPQTDFGSLVQAFYGIEEGISRGLWVDSSPSNSKGKKSGSGPRPLDVGTIGMMGHRSSRRPQTQRAYLSAFVATTSIRYTGILEATHAVSISIKHGRGQLDNSHSLGC
ncbi:hypothetical protein CK203_113885 [Vitis vinifera]|uniref:Uncharacterized protein n=1 Tax=Vitis vinifera TaxID=29760 RepID=A0A438BP10_VITVI|nr:hypothetical protein CK203_113885 [Vitis vinifera]